MVGAEVYVFSLLPALLWGAGAVVAKRGLAIGGSPLLVALFGTLLGTALLWAATAATGLGAALDRLTPVAVGVFVLAGLGGSAAGRLAYYTGLQRVGATVGDGITNAHPVLATLVALALVGEPIRAVEFVGMFVVVGGVVWLSVSKGGDAGGWARRELVFPVGVATLFGAGNALRRTGSSPPPRPPSRRRR